MAELEEEEGTGKSDKSLPCLLVSSAALSRSIIRLLYSFSRVNTAHVSVFPFCRLRSLWEGRTGLEESISRRNLLESFKWHRPLGNCYFSSSCHLLLRPAGLQTSFPFARSSLSHHGAMTNGNTLKNTIICLKVAMEQVMGASAGPYLCSHPQKKKRHLFC